MTLFGLPPIVILLALSMLLVLGAIAGAIYVTAFGPRARLQRRMAVVVGAAPRRGLKVEKGGARKKNIQSKLKELDEKRAKKKGSHLREDITQAGLDISVQKYFLYSAVSAVIGSLLYLASGLPDLGAIFVAIIMGLGFPKFVLRFLKNRRFKKFLSDFPDAIDVIVRGIKSGLPVGECINIIGREVADPVGLEFRMISEGQRIGMTLDEALGRMSDRVPLAEVRFFAIVLSIQQQTGGNLAETLSKLSEVLRARKKMKDKVAALSGEAKASAWIIGMMPLAVAGILNIVQPEYLTPLFTTFLGNILLVVAGVMMAIGTMIMRAMMNFEI